MLFVRFGTRAGIIGGGVTRLLQITNLCKNYKSYLITQVTTFSWLKKLGLKAEPYYLVKSEWTWKQEIPALIFSALNSILKMKSQMPIDVIYAFTHSLPDVLPAIWMKIKTGAKLVGYVQTPPLPSTHARSLFEFLLLSFDHAIALLLLRKYADLMITFNDQNARELIKMGFPENRVKLSGYGIDTSEIKSVKDIEERKNDGAFLGRLAPSKGIFELVKIWKKIHALKPQAKLEIAGPGAEEVIQKLRRQIDEANLSSNIILRGPLYGKDKIRFLKSSKIFINLGYEETWCITMCEAMACGCAVVTYASPAYERIYGDAILTAKMGDREEIANKILFLLNYDTERRKLGVKASQIALSYDWEKVAENECRLVKLLIGK